MSKDVVDFSEAGDAEFELVDPGWYQVSVYSVERDATPNGVEFYNFRLKIQAGDFQGRYLWLRNFVDAKDKNFYLKKTLTALGIKVDGKAKIDTDALCGLRAEVYVIHEEYNDKEREKVSDVRPAEAADPFAGATVAKEELPAIDDDISF